MARRNAIVAAGQIITATVTDVAGNTSPFSAGAAGTVTSSVNDGIANEWRAAHFGGNGTTTNNQSCATCDPDGDGANDMQEFFTGTDPTNAASRFLVSTTIPNGVGVALSFQSAPGIIYRLEARDDLNTNEWSILADQIVGTGDFISIADPAAAVLSKRFYRGKILR